MAGRVLAIHVSTDRAKDMDGRHTGGHDGVREPFPVMAGYGPAIHVSTYRAKDVDGRHRDGQDEGKTPAGNAIFNWTAVARDRSRRGAAGLHSFGCVSRGPASFARAKGFA